MLTGTILVALVALVFAFPLATGTAIYISEYAPQRIRRTLISLVDLMAAVPSVVFGIWGFLFLQYQIVGSARWLSTYFGWLPFLKVDGSDPDDPLVADHGFHVQHLHRRHRGGAHGHPDRLFDHA